MYNITEESVNLFCFSISLCCIRYLRLIPIATLHACASRNKAVRSNAHMGNCRPAGRMRSSTSFDPALIHFSELTHIKLTSYDLHKTHHVFSHQGLSCDSSKFATFLVTYLKGESSH
jgi:hypothetical protein